MSTEEPCSLSTVEISSSSQQTESDAQTSRTIHINEEKSTNKNSKSIPVQCQPSHNYPFPMKQFGKKNAVAFYSKGKDSVFCIFCIRHKLTAEHNIEEAYITKGFNNWKKALEAFADHQKSKAHRAAITYESVVPQYGDVLEMAVNDLNNKCIVERK